MRVLVAAVCLAAALAPCARAGQCEPSWSDAFYEASLRIQGEVRAIAEFDGALYFAGDFCDSFNDYPDEFFTCNIVRLRDGVWEYIGEPLGDVHDLLVHDDGSGPALYVAGEFVDVYTPDEQYVFSPGVARWDGEEWSDVDGGVILDFGVYALEVFQGQLHAGGDFFPFSAGDGNLARWNGSSWSDVGNGVDGGAVYALHTHNDGQGAKLYVGGDFDQVGDSISINFLARWNGAAWSTIGNLNGDSVRAIASYDEVLPTVKRLWIGGVGLYDAGGVAIENIAAWDLVNGWVAPTNPFALCCGGVYDMLPFADADGERLYFVGDFFTNGGDMLGRISGTTIDEQFGLPSCCETALALAQHDGQLLIGGDFYNSVLAYSDGVFRESLGEGVNNLYQPRLFIADDGTGDALFLVEPFDDFLAGGRNAGRIARLSGGQWDNLEGGLYWYNVFPEVYDVVTYDDGSGPSVYVAGAMDAVSTGDEPPFFREVRNIARWNGLTREWSDVGLGVNQTVYDLEVWDDGAGAKLYAACDFFEAGGVPVNRIAGWDGQQWHHLGGPGAGLSGGTVRLLAAYNGSLYAAGDFTGAGGNPDARFIARWDGASWTTVGAGVEGYIERMFVADDGAGEALFITGSFYLADGQPVDTAILRWNGMQWDDLEGKFNSCCVDDAVSFDAGAGPRLYLAGNFFMFDDAGADTFGLVEWNGAARTWSNPASISPDNAVLDLQIFNDGSGEALYAAGYFTEIAGLAARRIARFDGATWSILDLGLNDTQPFNFAFVNAIAAVPGETTLHAAGEFRTAGANRSHNFASWEACVPPAPPTDFTLSMPFNGAINVPLSPELRWTASANAQSYGVEVLDSSGPRAVVHAAYGIQTTSHQMPMGILDPAQTYAWRVTAYNAGGQSIAAPGQFLFTTAESCPGDTNGDMIVDFSDLNAVLVQFGQSGPGLSSDVTGDGVVGFADLNFILVFFGTDCL